MNNKLILAVGAVVIIGVIAFFVMRGPANNSPSEETSDKNITSAKMSMKSLIGSASPQECTFINKESGSDTAGTVYVMSGKMRGDFNSTVNGKAELSHMIVDGDTSYVWTDSPAQGFKVSLADMSKQQNNQNSVDVNKEVDYSCKGWSPDSGKFALPSNITFSDLGELMKNSLPPQGAAGGVPTGGTDVKSAQCGACDSLTGEERAACRAALGC